MKHLISEYFAYRKERQFQITFRKLIRLKEKEILGTANTKTFHEIFLKNIDEDMERLIKAYSLNFKNNQQ